MAGKQDGSFRDISFQKKVEALGQKKLTIFVIKQLKSIRKWHLFVFGTCSIAALLAYLLLLLNFSFWTFHPMRYNVPTDASLISEFVSHRRTFEELGQMAVQDELKKFYVDSRDKEQMTKLLLSRRLEYEEKLSSLGQDVDLIVDSFNVDQAVVKFIYSYEGDSAIGPGWQKGIEHIEVLSYQRPPGLISNNLDKVSLLPAEVYLRPIEKNWFIAFEKFD